MRRMVITLLSFIIFGGATISAAPPCGDVNYDANINILDIVHLINFKYKGGDPPDCGTVTDYDGNTYETVTIGELTWMAENLKVTHYRNGDAIPDESSYGTWATLSTGAYSDYFESPSNVYNYGRLYNWFAVEDSRNIAPEGWHIATDDDWQILEMALGMSPAQAAINGFRGTDEGGKLKDLLSGLWSSPNTGATNESGFNGLPGGMRADDEAYTNMPYTGFFWTATEFDINQARYRSLDYLSAQVYRAPSYKSEGMSVRCVKD